MTALIDNKLKNYKAMFNSFFPFLGVFFNGHVLFLLFSQTLLFTQSNLFRYRTMI